MSYSLSTDNFCHDESSRNMGKTIHFLTIEKQSQTGWSYDFANAYVVNVHIEGMSHKRAYDEAMASPYVKGRDKPLTRLGR